MLWVQAPAAELFCQGSSQRHSQGVPMAPFWVLTCISLPGKRDHVQKTRPVAWSQCPTGLSPGVLIRELGDAEGSSQRCNPVPWIWQSTFSLGFKDTYICTLQLPDPLILKDSIHTAWLNTSIICKMDFHFNTACWRQCSLGFVQQLKCDVMHECNIS